MEILIDNHCFRRADLHCSFVSDTVSFKTLALPQEHWKTSARSHWQGVSYLAAKAGTGCCLPTTSATSKTQVHLPFLQHLMNAYGFKVQRREVSRAQLRSTVTYNQVIRAWGAASASNSPATCWWSCFCTMLFTSIPHLAGPQLKPLAAGRAGWNVFKQCFSS